MAENTEIEERVEKWLSGKLTTAEVYDLTPGLTKALAEHGYLLYEEGKYDSARVIFEALAVVNGSDPNIQKMLGSIYQIHNKWDASYYHYTQALKSAPNDIFVIVNRGETLIHMQRPREAAEDLKRAIQLDPDGKNPVGRRARVLFTNLSNVQRWAPPRK
ncbi:tetratricopeptide repeat protein [bacterium]|nr:tetratricopeptide repeat protein [bacterium]MCI0606925.1 tetratricopeptide repeat protein [bacterium]